MPSTITSTDLKQQQFNNQKLHFTPLIPKSNNVSKKATSNNHHDHNLVIKTSKRWILPPRPRPGRKTSTCNSLISCSNASPISPTSHNDNNLHFTNNKNVTKKDSIVQSTASSKNKELNYLAFLKFEENENNTDDINNSIKTINKRSISNESSQTLTTDSIPTSRVITKNLPLLMISHSKEITPSTTRTNSISPLDFTKPKHPASKLFDAPFSPLDLSPSSTIVSTPSSNNANINRRFSAPVKSSALVSSTDNNYEKIYNMDFMNVKDADMNFDLFSTNDNNNQNKIINENNKDDANLNLDNEDELYNNIWEFLPRYTNKNKNQEKKDVCSDIKDNESTHNYFYMAPSLEELMEEQDNFLNLFDESVNNGSKMSTTPDSSDTVMNEFNDFTSTNNKNFITTNEFDDDDFDILKV